ncbi:MAG: SDR family NAD(P)-dependent oxidoreductase [Hyphomicrobiaceae bacterium]
MGMLSSFQDPIDALVVGANGGLGQAFVEALSTDENIRRVHTWSRRRLADGYEKLSSCVVDVGDEAELRSAARKIDRLSLIIVATGVLHDSNGLFPEKSFKSLDPVNMAESFRVNAILPAMVAKHALPRFPRNERTVFCALSARIGSISDNRLGGWHSYRASKAALNQIIKCLSIELRRTHPDAVCIGLHPGTVDTGLSQPFQKSLAPGQSLFQPAKAVDQLLNVINASTPDQSGSLFAWDGELIPA